MKQKNDRFMWLESIKENKVVIVVLAIIGGIFYLMNVWTPLYSDDWHYCFIYGTTQHIHSIGDILASQYVHYFEVNGRFIPHFFVQLFDGIIGKEGFNIANAIMFVAFFHLLVATVSNERKQYYGLLTIALLFVLLVLPGFKLNFLWMSGACNYLWSAVFILIFHRLLNHPFKSATIYPLLFCYGIISGWTHEGLVIGLAGGYFLYYLIHKEELTAHRSILLAGFFIGVLFMVFSPGNIHRALGDGERSKFDLVSAFRTYGSALLAMKNLRIFFILLSVLLIGYISRYKSFIKGFVKENWICIVVICISFIFIVFTKFDSDYSRFGIEIYSLILLLRLFTRVSIPKTICSICTILLCMFLSFMFLPLNYANHKEFLNIIAKIKSHDTEFIQYSNRPNNSIYQQRFVISSPPNYLEVAMPYKKDNWENTIIANYYQTDSLAFIPSLFLDDLKQKPANYEHFHTDRNLPFYAKRLPEGTDIKNVTFLLRETKKEEIPFYFRPFANRLARYSATEIGTDKYAVVEIEGDLYLLVSKNPMIDFRMKDIRIN